MSPWTCPPCPIGIDTPAHPSVGLVIIPPPDWFYHSWPFCRACYMVWCGLIFDGPLSNQLSQPDRLSNSGLQISSLIDGQFLSCLAVWIGYNGGTARPGGLHDSLCRAFLLWCVYVQPLDGDQSQILRAAVWLVTAGHVPPSTKHQVEPGSRLHGWSK